MAIDPTEERDDMPLPISSTLRAATGLVLVAIIAACGGGPTASAQAPATAPATTEASADATGGASPIAEATPGPSVVVPSLTADTPLVDILPKELGGEATQTYAFVGNDLSAIDPSAAMIFGSITSILWDVASTDPAARAGALLRRVIGTIGTAANSRASVIAIRIAGKSAQDITDAMVAARTLNATTTKDELDLGGKHVLKVTTTIAPLPFYVYAIQDVSFTIAGADESVVAEALSKLP